MSSKLLIKITQVVVIIMAILMSKLISENFIVIPKIIFWFECFMLGLAAFISSEKLIKDWKYVTNFHIAWDVIYFILSAFFIAYEGWFLLLCFYIPTQIIGLTKTIVLNQMITNKESTND